MKVRTAILIGFALLLAHPFSLQAQIPRTISYQGIVTDAAGNVKPDATYRFQFEIYDAETGGNLLWGPQTEDLETKNGLFYTQLGPFPASLTFNNPYWLGIIVGGEILSRVPLTSVGYSFSALRADTAEYAWQTPTGEGLTLPYSGTYSGGSNAFEITNTGSGQALKIHNQGTNYALGIFNDASAMYGIKISNDSNYPAIKITSYNSGNNDALEVNQNGTGYAGYFAGNVYTTGTYQGSDVRWKRNIAPLEGALGQVLDMRGVRFEWNLEEYPDNGFREGKQIGLIAQEVEKVLPELVRNDRDGYKAVDYQKVTAVLVEAIKEQQQEIEALKDAVAALQAQSDVALQELVQE